jgi:hypothetical protein
MKPNLVFSLRYASVTATSHQKFRRLTKSLFAPRAISVPSESRRLKLSRVYSTTRRKYANCSVK